MSSDKMWWNFFLQSHICCWLCVCVCVLAFVTLLFFLLLSLPRYFILKHIHFFFIIFFFSLLSFEILYLLMVWVNFSSYLKRIYCFLWFSTCFPPSVLVFWLILFRIIGSSDDFIFLFSTIVICKIDRTECMSEQATERTSE